MFVNALSAFKLPIFGCLYGEKQLTENRPSYVCGIGGLPLVYETIGQLLSDAATTNPDHEALISRHQEHRFTYGELDTIVDKIAAGLLTLGLRRGDRLGIWSPNCAEWIITQFATARIGVILVNINPAYRLSELEYALNKTECKSLILASSFKTSDYIEMVRALAPEIGDCEPGALHAEKLPHLRVVAVIGTAGADGFLSFSDIENAATSQWLECLPDLQNALDPDDAINIQFTSGTTGTPKGATLTHRNLVNNARFSGERQTFGATDRLCIPVPLYHCFGMVLGVLTCVSYGATMVLPASSFDEESVLQTVQAEKCTALYGVPAMFISILGHPDLKAFDLSSLRTGMMAGSPCPIEIMKRVIGDMNMADVTIGYGMTELSPLSFQTGPNDSLEQRVSSVGLAHPYVETKIVDEEDQIVLRGQQGEILSRGYSVMKGYWNDPERTAEAIDENGWMRTGDLGVIDDQGYCSITGRSKDMIIRGGENIYPAEIENFLFRHPDIETVQVIGVPDDKYGEEVCAWLKLKPAANMDYEEVRGFCEGEIAHFKIPRYVKFVDDFPMTVTGKIQKFRMREMMIDELGLTAVETV